MAKELNSGLTRRLNWRLCFASPALWLLGHGCFYMAQQHIQANFNLPEISSFIVRPDFSLILCLGATKFKLITFFILIMAIYVKFWEKMEKVSFPFFYQLFWTQACPERSVHERDSGPTQGAIPAQSTTRKCWPHHRGRRSYSFRIVM